MSRAIFKIFFCGAALFLIAEFSACTHTPRDKDGTWTASWYGEPFHGRKTASGETYNMYGLSAAHKHLPFGTRLHVTNPQNGKSTVVTINDRGPFVRGRDLDLSLGAARALDMIEDGVILVDVRVLKSDSSYTREYANEAQGFAVQVASFSDRNAAQRLQAQLKQAYSDARITTVQSGGKTYYRILVGSFSTRAAAETEVNRLRSSGYSPLIREFF